MTDNKPSVEIKKVPNLFFFHPLAVIVMLLLDWGGFVFEVPQILSPLTLILTFSGIFISTTIITFFIQKYFTAESNKINIAKALVAGLVCAVPTGIMSTIIGSIILGLSGFNSLAIDGLPGLLNMFKKRDK
jgi:hypothetical protein